jgi:hypothetical protein
MCYINIICMKNIKILTQTFPFYWLKSKENSTHAGEFTDFIVKNMLMYYITHKK